MIGKIITGKSFKGAVEYVMNKPGSQLLACDGVDAADARSVTRSFNFQRKARPEKEYVVGHISLSFHPDDTPKLTDETMITLAEEYMRRMGITDTQYIVARHNDTEHPHIHIVYNRVKDNAKLVKRHNEQIRNVAVCKAMKRKYGLTFSEGKENVKTEKLHGPVRVKYAIYGAVKEALPRCLSLAALADELKRQGIATAFVHRGGDPSKEVQGLTFTKDNVTFKASQIDRKFSYGNLCKAIEANRVQAETAARQAEKQRQREQADELKRQQRKETARLRREEQARRTEKEFQKLWAEMFSEEGRAKPQESEQAQVVGQSEEAPRASAERQPIRERKMPPPAATPDNPPTERLRKRITEIRGEKLTPEEQRRLYSPQGLTLTYNKEDMEYTVLCRPFARQDGPDILTEHPVSQRRIDRNPTVYGVRLSDEQVRKIRDGEYIRLENMQREDGTLFSGYVVMDDRFTTGWIFQQPPDRWVKHGKYEMWEMDKILIENNFVAHALVKWWGIGQTERLYLWKEKPEDTDYKESWNDPRKPARNIRPTVKQVPADESRPDRPTVRVPEPPKRRRGPKM